MYSVQVYCKTYHYLGNAYGVYCSNKPEKKLGSLYCTTATSVYIIHLIITVKTKWEIKLSRKPHAMIC